MHSLLEQENKSRLKNGTLVIGKADFPGDSPEVSFNTFKMVSILLLNLGFAIRNWRRAADFEANRSNKQ